jgi:NOL1/NOP2/fmu family ribosome biogenesis protein
MNPREHRSNKIGFSRIPERDVNSICRLIRDEYGFNLNQLFERQNISLWKKIDEMRLLPNQSLKELDRLQLITSGLRLGELLESGFSPSHEFAARFGLLFQTGKIVLADEFLPNWLRGEDLRGFTTPEYSKGKVVVVTDRHGRNLGRGKLQSEKLKNLLPNRLF